MRYVWDPKRGVIPKKEAARRGGVVTMRDIEPFRTQDGVLIASRSTLRDYERRNGVRQIGNDWAGDSDLAPTPAEFGEWKK